MHDTVDQRKTRSIARKIFQIITPTNCLQLRGIWDAREALFLFPNPQPEKPVSKYKRRPKLQRMRELKRSTFDFVQEPKTGSEQLSCDRVTKFSRSSLFLEPFWREFWISFKFHKPASKTYRPKNDIFCLLITFSFPFWYFILRMRS